ncbi:MAG: hypothetical protein D6B27_05955 [Gammaproteobacteria bacterium]|nr:MAG: hypothetical protein D6B27_05955 [Gammaproteobacteria bacterium]
MNSATKKFLFSLIMLISVHAQAAKSEIGYGVETKFSYSDNIYRRDNNIKSDFYTSIEPFINLKMAGRKNSIELNYSFFSRIYHEADFHEYVSHSLFSNIITEPIDDTLFINLKIKNEQIIDDPSGAIAFDGYHDEDSTINVFSLLAEPRFYRRISRNVEVNLYTWFGFDLYDPGRQDTERRGANLVIGSHAGIDRFNWKISSYYDKTHIRNIERSQLQRDTLYLSYPLFNRFVVFAEGGVEKETFRAPSDYPTQKDETNEVGFKWFPTKRTYLQVSSGNRVYGSVYSFDFKHTRKNSSLNIYYSEALTQVTALAVDTAVDVENYIGDISDLFRIENDTFIQEKLAANYVLNGRKNYFLIGTGRDIRRYRHKELTEKLYSFNLTWKYSYSGKTTFRINGNWSRLCESFDERLDDLSMLTIGVDRNIGKKSTAYLQASKQIRDGKEDVVEYKEMIFSVGTTIIY